MSTTSKKPPTKHEPWQDEIKTTEDQYREYDAWVRSEKELEERRKNHIIQELVEQRERMFAEKERNEEKERLILENKQRILNEKIVKEEKIETVKKKWYIRVLNFFMGWE